MRVWGGLFALVMALFLVAGFAGAGMAQSKVKSYDGFDNVVIEGAGKGGVSLHKLAMAEDVAKGKAAEDAQRQCKIMNGSVLDSYREIKATGGCSCKTISNGEHICECRVNATCAKRILSVEEKAALDIMSLYVKDSAGKMREMLNQAKANQKAGLVTVEYLNRVRDLQKKFDRLKQGLGGITNPKIKRVYVQDLSALYLELQEAGI